MFFYKILVPCFLLHLRPSSAGQGDVLELNDANFDQKLSQHDTSMVFFYAPWCPYCQKLQPKYAEAAGDLNEYSNIALAKVDCTGEGKKACEKNGVNEYPTLKVYNKGEYAEDYNGAREAGGIASFLRAKAGPGGGRLMKTRFNEEGAENLKVGEDLDNLLRMSQKLVEEDRKNRKSGDFT